MACLRHGLRAATTPIVVLLNGPPACGKDSMAMALAQTHPHVVHRELKHALTDHVLQYTRLDRATWQRLCQRSRKEVPQACLNGRSPREVMIYVSEHIVKPLYGMDYFVTSLADQLRGDEIAVVSDCGFPEERQVLQKRFGKDNVILVQLQRPGCTFARDSRNYLAQPDLVLRNQGTLADWQARTNDVMKLVYART